MTMQQNIAIIGGGMAGIACARTLAQAGHQVTVLEKNADVGGRMATITTPYGLFDSGSQYFTVRDDRFAQALQTVAGLCRPWSANTVRLLDERGRVAAAGLARGEPHWVPTPGMNELVRRWAQPLADRVLRQTLVTRIQRDALKPRLWQLQTLGAQDSQQVLSGFDTVLLALPSGPAQLLLEQSGWVPALTKQIDKVQVAPCWTLMLAFPQAMQPGLITLGPQWNAARSTHHRIAWLARESSKPARTAVERWTVQASARWSQEHLLDDPARVQAKLLKAFSEVTGIRAQPSQAGVMRWRYAQTTQALGKSHLWDSKTRIGVCGDWCLGRRVEDAFVSGLELALNVAGCR